MGLTLEAEQRLEAAGVIAHYAENEAAWLAAIKETKKYVEGNFPAGAKIRKDDIAKALVTIIEVNESYQDYRNVKKLRAKFWNTLFADLVVDRTWDQLEAENEDGEDGAEP
ncbi:MAG: hypothetical protein ACTHJR_06210 [Sphingomonas sp.]|uniref:hypothetical protein n=1 Tax=Sphingomonas sp. TaxID=28214 RepID=UPI003F7F1E1E